MCHMWPKWFQFNTQIYALTRALTHMYENVSAMLILLLSTNMCQMYAENRLKNIFCLKTDNVSSSSYCTFISITETKPSVFHTGIHITLAFSILIFDTYIQNI